MPVKGPYGCGCQMPLSPAIKACTLWRRLAALWMAPAEKGSPTRRRLQPPAARAVVPVADRLDVLVDPVQGHEKLQEHPDGRQAQQDVHRDDQDQHEYAARGAAVLEAYVDEDDRPQRRPED